MPFVEQGVDGCGHGFNSLVFLTTDHTKESGGQFAGGLPPHLISTICRPK